MTVRREAVVVCAVSLLALAPAIVGLTIFNSIAIPACAPAASSTPPPTPPSSEVLLLVGDNLSISAGRESVIWFNLRAPADIQGAWQGSAPLFVGVLNTTVIYHFIPPSDQNGTLNGTTLFPGPYALVVGYFPTWKWSSPPPAPANFTVT